MGLLDCTDCDLHLHRTQVVPGQGPSPASVMFVGEAPGRQEDEQGLAFVGDAGLVLTEACLEAGLDRDAVYITNVVKCKPPANRDPQPEELSACQRYLLAQLFMVRPKVVVAMGRFAAAFFLGKDPRDVKTTRDRGGVMEWRHPKDPKLRITVLVTLHPAFVLYEKRRGSGEEAFESLAMDLMAAKSMLVSDTDRIPSDTGTRVRRPYLPEVEFLCGVHRGDRLHLVFRDQEGNRAVHTVPPEEARWYFLIHSGDVTPHLEERIGTVLREGVVYRKERLRVLSMERDLEIPEWVRVYPNVPQSWVSRECKLGLSDEEARRLTTVSPLIKLAKLFDLHGVRTFEADVDPLRRFMVDRKVRIAEHHRRCWVDIETDDRHEVSVREIVGKVPILSIAAVFEDGSEWFAMARSTELADERELLQAFCEEVLPRVDWLSGWYTEDFDWPFMWTRFNLHQIRVPLWQWVWWDGYFSFTKHHYWDAEGKQSNALEAVSQAILGEGKLERPPKVSWMYANDPERLKAYNVRDSQLTRRIEQKTGYCSIDQEMSRIGNCFPSNVYVAMRIDGLALSAGYERGTHFRTKRMPLTRDEQYIGAYVLPPVKGDHRNVANLDFSSLYPSSFISWNISPDTLVPEEDLSSVDPSLLCTCPEFRIEGEEEPVGGARFLREPRGILPSVYEHFASKRAEWKREMARRADTHGVKSPEWWDAKRREYCFKQMGLSIYGVMGSPYSRYFHRAVAQAVTLSAQYMIRAALALAERMDFRPLYGDSITGDRPVVLRLNGRVWIAPIEEVFERGLEPGSIVWRDGEKLRVKIPGLQALASGPDGDGWYPVKELIAHRCQKEVWRVSNKRGQTEVTADHSIISDRGPVTPAEFVEQGAWFQQVTPPAPRGVGTVDIYQEISRFQVSWTYKGRRLVRRFGLSVEEDHVLLWGWGRGSKYRIRRYWSEGSPELRALLRIMGAYLSEGSASLKPEACRFLLSFSQADRTWLERLREDLDLAFPGFRWTGPLETDGCHVLRNGTTILSCFMAALCGHGSDGKRFPSFVFDLRAGVQEDLLRLMYEGDGSAEDSGIESYTTKSPLLAAGLSFLLAQRGEGHAIHYREGTYTLRDRPAGTERVRMRTKVRRREHDGLVYDLSVDRAESFCDGIGRVLLHNTDSLFIQITDPEQVPAFIEKAHVLFRGICEQLNCPTCLIELEWEQYFDRIVLVAKKRYMGHLTIQKGQRADAMEIKGLEMVRSDGMALARKVQTQVMDGLFRSKWELSEVRRFLLGIRERVFAGKLSAEQLQTTAALTKPPREYKGNSRNTPHVRLAEELMKRGEQVFVGTKIAYIVTEARQSPMQVEAVHHWGGVYDPFYYWMKRIWPPCERIVKVLWPDHPWDQEMKVRRKAKRRKPADGGGKTVPAR